MQLLPQALLTPPALRGNPALGTLMARCNRCAAGAAGLQRGFATAQRPCGARGLAPARGGATAIRPPGGLSSLQQLPHRHFSREAHASCASRVDGIPQSTALVVGCGLPPKGPKRSGPGQCPHKAEGRPSSGQSPGGQPRCSQFGWRLAAAATRLQLLCCCLAPDSLFAKATAGPG